MSFFVLICFVTIQLIKRVHPVDGLDINKKSHKTGSQKNILLAFGNQMISIEKSPDQYNSLNTL